MHSWYAISFSDVISSILFSVSWSHQCGFSCFTNFVKKLLVLLPLHISSELDIYSGQLSVPYSAFIQLLYRYISSLLYKYWEFSYSRLQRLYLSILVSYSVPAVSRCISFSSFKTCRKYILTQSRITQIIVVLLYLCLLS